MFLTRVIVENGTVILPAISEYKLLTLQPSRQSRYENIVTIILNVFSYNSFKIF
jgi:hypothetical protein